MYGFLYFHRLKEEKTAEKEEESEEESTDADLNFNKDEIQKMREMARKLSQKIEQDKVTKLLQGSDVKQGSSDSGSDSKDKETRNAKSTDNDSCRNISKTKSHVKESSYGTIATDMNKLKHFRIKKKPTTSSSLEKPVEAATDATKPPSTECVKTGTSSSTGLKRKSSSEQDDARDKHKKKKHKKKDASQCFFFN